jgi:hypothetical protein
MAEGLFMRICWRAVAIVVSLSITSVAKRWLLWKCERRKRHSGPGNMVIRSIRLTRLEYVVSKRGKSSWHRAIVSLGSVAITEMMTPG